jgi:putative membrane protein
MPLHAHDAWEPWPVGLTVVIVILAAAYIRGWARLRWSSSNPLPAWRALSYLAGLATAWIAVASPIGAGDERLLTFHMVQHLALMTVAPPLIFLGEPVMALLGGPTPRHAAVIAFRRTPLQRIAVPAVCWLAATATLVAWHVPAAFTFALRSPTWHAVEQASFLASGLLFWWPVVQPWPSPANRDWSTVLYLFLATLPCDILSGFLVFSDRVAYSAYLSSSSGPAVLDDQQLAGALMWTCVTIVYLVAGAIVSTQLLAWPDQRPRLLEVV